ncbi:MAG: hypothetical protein Kow00106_21010 [Anaerolineae bacterium]
MIVPPIAYGLLYTTLRAKRETFQDARKFPMPIGISCAALVSPGRTLRRMPLPPNETRTWHRASHQGYVGRIGSGACKGCQRLTGHGSVYLTPSLASLGSPPSPRVERGAARRVSAERG